MISESDIQSANLAYYGGQHNSRQWRAFILTLLEEMHQSAGPDDASAFLRHVGQRMAQAHPLGEQGTLEALEGELNRAMRDMEWGWVRLAIEGATLRIVHGAYPGIQEKAEPWGQSIAAVLEGMYQHWFQQQNAEVTLTVRCIEASASGALVFRCGC